MASRPEKNSIRASPRSSGFDGLNQKRVQARTAVPISVARPSGGRCGDFVDEMHSIGPVDVPSVALERPVRVVQPHGSKGGAIVCAAFALRLVARQGVREHGVQSHTVVV